MTDLEMEYVPSLRVRPQPYFDRYRELSERAVSRLTCLRDLPFGKTPDEVLDLFVTSPEAPVVMFLHGGYWQAFSKNEFSFVALGLVPHGVNVAVVNYALAPAVPLATIVEQCRRAVTWLRTQSPLRRAPLVAAGHSAGGHLSAMCATALPIEGVVTISGLHDLRPLVSTSINTKLGLDARTARELSPIFEKPVATPRVYATAGSEESGSFHEQGRSLAKTWAALGCDARYVESPHENHFSIVEQLADPESVLSRSCVDLTR